MLRHRISIDAGRRGMQVVIALENTDEGTLVRVAGDLDATTREEWEAALAAAAIADPHGVVVDMGGVTFCDAAGLAPLVRLQVELSRTRRELVVRHPSRVVRRLLELTGLTAVLATSDTRRAPAGAPRSAMAASLTGWMRAGPVRVLPGRRAPVPCQER